MKLLPWILANPDAVAAFVTLLGSVIGVKRVQRARELAEVQVERWANAAAEAIVKVAEATGDHDAEALANKGLQFFRKMAAGAGVKLTPEHEARAHAILIEALNRLGERLQPEAKARLGGAARQLLRKLEDLKTYKAKPMRGGLGVEVTRR